MNINLESIEYSLAIIPTVLIPLTMISVGISIVASFIAALFGVELKTEGPKRLLEVLLKPKVLLSALVFNLCVYGASKWYVYESTKPRPLFWIKWQSNPKPSSKNYEDVVLNAYEVKTFGRSSKDFKEPALIWEKKLKKGGFRPPSFSGGSLFVSSFDKNVYEIDFNTGESLRVFKAGAPISVEPNIYKGNIYFGEGVHETHKARIYSYSLKGGSLQEAKSTAGHIEAHARIASHKEMDLLFTPSGKGGLYAFKLPKLELLWNQPVGHIDSPVLVDEGIVYTNTGREKHNPDLFRSYGLALDIETGAVLWKKEMPVSSWYQPILYKGDICFVLGEVYFDMNYGGLECFNKKTGDYKRTLRMNGPVVALPLVTEKGIYLATSYGEVCFWDIESDKTKWCESFSKDSKKVSYTNIVYDPKRSWLLYPFGESLYIINPESGDLIKEWKPKKVLPTYSTVLIIESDSWILYSKKGHLVRFDFR